MPVMRMCKNMVEQNRPHEIIQCCAQNMRFACRSTRARMQKHTHTHTHTHSRYLILTDFPGQQWLRERILILRYTYTVFLVILSFHFNLGLESVSSSGPPRQNGVFLLFHNSDYLKFHNICSFWKHTFRY